MLPTHSGPAISFSFFSLPLCSFFCGSSCRFNDSVLRRLEQSSLFFFLRVFVPNQLECTPMRTRIGGEGIFFVRIVDYLLTFIFFVHGSLVLVSLELDNLARPVVPHAAIFPVSRCIVTSLACLFQAPSPFVPAGRCDAQQLLSNCDAPPTSAHA